jgi:hypothetical protein
MKRRIYVHTIATILAFVIFLAGCANPATQTTSATLTGVNSTSSKSANGLSLSLSLNATTYWSGQLVSITLEERNILSTTNHIPQSDNWPLSGLSLGPCSEDFPLGVAVFSGYYSSADVLKGKPLIIQNPNEVWNCPSGLPTDITGYDFKPFSDTAIILSQYSSDISSPFEMYGEVSPDGYWTESSAPAVQHDFDPGIYTVVGGDEWGGLVVLHFKVTDAVSKQVQPSVEVLSVSNTNLNDPRNPQFVEIDLQNISDKPIISLGVFYISDRYQEDSFYFEVTAEKPLPPGKKVIGFGDARNFGDSVPYFLKINGTFQDGTFFYFTWQPQSN